MGEIAKAFDHNAGARQQHHGDGRLGDDHGLPESLALAPCRGTAAGILERRLNIGSRHRQRRRQATQQAAEQRDREGKPDHACSKFDEPAGNRVGRHNRRRDVDQAPGHRQTQRAAGERQQRTFRKELPHQTARALRLARSAPRFRARAPPPAPIISWPRSRRQSAGPIPPRRSAAGGACEMSGSAETPGSLPLERSNPCRSPDKSSPASRAMMAISAAARARGALSRAMTTRSRKSRSWVFSETGIQMSLGRHQN